MEPYFGRFYGNPSSSHAIGVACQEAIECAREHVASLLGAQSEEILFTSGGTESNNLALKGVFSDPMRQEGHLIISNIEHPAVAEPAKYLRSMGVELTVVECDRDGIVSPDAIAAAIRSDTRLVSVMHANNEVGTVQPIREISNICRQRGVLLHTDAAQTVGKINTRTDYLNVDMLTLAGHKFYAPKGIGALYVRGGVQLQSLLHGAGHECGRRAGTENVPYIVGLGQAAKLAARSIDESVGRLAGLRDRLLAALREGVGSTLTVNAEAAERLPTTLSVNFPGAVGAEILQRAPELCASTGSACHSSQITISPTLAAMGVSPDVARGTIRLSVGWYTSEDDVDRAADLLIAAWETLR